MGEGRKTGMFENKTPTTQNPTKPHKQKKNPNPNPTQTKGNTIRVKPVVFVNL